MRFFKDLSLSALTAGFVAVLVGFTSSVAIVFQAAQAFADVEQLQVSQQLGAKNHPSFANPDISPPPHRSEDGIALEMPEHRGTES
jgi:hypothetical protein